MASRFVDSRIRIGAPRFSASDFRFIVADTRRVSRASAPLYLTFTLSLTARSRFAQRHRATLRAQRLDDGCSGSGHQQSPPSPLVREDQEDHLTDIPNLIEIQKRSYVRKFLQADVAADQREDKGLQSVFKSVFPIKDFNETASLEFVSYELGTPKYDVEECHQRGMTFAAPIKVKIQLVIWDVESGPPLDQERQGAGSLLRRNSADDRQRHLHGERDRARHRVAAASLARGVLRA